MPFYPSEVEARTAHSLEPNPGNLFEIINLFLRDFKVNAACKQLNKFHEMVIIALIQEATFKKHGCKV